MSALDQLDPLTRATKVIPYPHSEMHSKSHFFIKTFLEDTGGDNNVTYFGFTTPAESVTKKEIHAKAILVPDVDFEVEIFEGGTYTGGTPIVGKNNYRRYQSSHPPFLAAALLVAGDISAIGDSMWSARNGGGRNPLGVATSLNYEIIADYDTQYIFKLTKHVATAGIVDIDFFWYEHAPKTL